MASNKSSISLKLANCSENHISANKLKNSWEDANLIEECSSLKDETRKYNQNSENLSPSKNKAILEISSSYGSLKSNYFEKNNSSLNMKSNDQSMETKQKENKPSSSGIQGLFLLTKTPAMRKITITVFIVWILEAALYYGILLNASNFTKYVFSVFAYEIF